jgi:hypothetical protein
MRSSHLDIILAQTMHHCWIQNAEAVMVFVWCWLMPGLLIWGSVMFVHTAGGNFVSLAGGNVCCLFGDGDCERRIRKQKKWQNIGRQCIFTALRRSIPSFEENAAAFGLRTVHPCQSGYSMPWKTVQDQTDEVLREEDTTAARPKCSLKDTKQNAERFAPPWYTPFQPKEKPPVFTPSPDVRKFLEWVGIVEETRKETNDCSSSHTFPSRAAAQRAGLWGIVVRANHRSRDISALQVDHLLAWRVCTVSDALSSATAVSDGCQSSFTIEWECGRRIVDGAVSGPVEIEGNVLLAPGCQPGWF